MIAALLEKDIKLFFRNQFMTLITVLGLVAYIVVFLLLPDEVDQTLDLAVYSASGDVAMFGDAIRTVTFETEEALIATVEEGDYPVGIVLTSVDTVSVYYAPGTTESVRNTYDDVLTMMFNASAATVGATTEMVGPQTLDAPLPLRNRLLPTLVLILFFIEMMGLANLIVEEIESGAAQGVLTTPLNIGQFLTAKALMGVGLAFIQTLILLVVVGAFFEAPLIILATLVVGGVFSCGVAFVIAALARDFTSVIGWYMLFVLSLLIPGITLIAPGLATDVVTYIPSYFFLDAMHQAVNLDAGWGDVMPSLLALLLTGAALIGLGSTFLRRRLI